MVPALMSSREALSAVSYSDATTDLHNIQSIPKSQTCSKFKKFLLSRNAYSLYAVEYVVRASRGILEKISD